MSVTVIRGAGDIPGEAIVSEILTTEALQKERATQELNMNDSDRIDQSGNIIGFSPCEPGDIVQVTHKGEVHRGYVKSSSVSVNYEGGYSVSTAVDIELVDI